MRRTSRKPTETRTASLRKRERAALAGGPIGRSLGSDLLSHSVSRAVPSALEGLTSGFGMGPGVPPPPWPPKLGVRSVGFPTGTRVRMRPEQSSEHDSEREQKSQVLGLLVRVS